MNTLNADLAWRALDHIEAHPDQYTPHTEIAQVDDHGNVLDAGGRTVADFAGRACLLSGDRLDTGDHGHDGTGVLTADGQSFDAYDRALDLLGLTPDVNDWVFNSASTAELRAAVVEVFGDRGGAVAR